MLTRSTQIGEFYVMMPPQIEPTGGGAAAKHSCDLLIYDEESDKHVRISWGDAMKACCIEGITVATPIVGSRGGGMTAGDARITGAGRFQTAGQTNANSWYFAAEQIRCYNEQEDFDKNAGGIPDWVDLNPDIRIVLARPFIEHLMHSAILCVAGRDTGATLFGPADMQLSANTQVKTIEGHYTGHFKSVVTKPQNVYVMRDIACAGYVAGCNTQFFAKKNDGSFSLDEAQNNIMRRLSFADDVGASYASMLAFPCMAGQFESGHLDTVMSVTTRLLPWEVTSAGGGMHKSFPGGEEMFKEYSNTLGLSSIHFGEDMKAAENMEFISQGSTNNATCFLGPHRRYDPFTKAFYSLEPGQGHFGPDAIPGDARWRRGESVSLKAARDSMVGLELASQAQMVYQKRS